MRRLLFGTLLIWGTFAAAAEVAPPAPVPSAVDAAIVVHLDDPAKWLREAQSLEIAAPEATLEDLLAPAFEKLGLPTIPSIDPTRPITAAVTEAGLRETPPRWTVALAVRDLDAALGALAAMIERDEVVVRTDPPYLIVGRDPDAVARFDRKRTLASPDTPPGIFSVELDIESMASTLVARIADWPEQARASALSGESATPSAEATTTSEVLGEIGGLASGIVSSLVENSSRLILSLERIEPQLLLHARLVPRVGSDLETLLRSQPEEFPKLGRAIPVEGAIGSYAGDFRMTPIFEQGLLSVMERQFALFERLLPGEAFEAIRGPAEMQQRLIRCMRGDLAGTVSMGEGGIQTTSVFGIKSGSACQDLLEVQQQTYATLLGQTASPWSAPSAEGGKTVQGAVFEDPKADSINPTSMARVDDVLITTSGALATPLLAEIVERQVGRSKAQGLGPERFAPLTARAGFFMELDLGSLGPPTTEGSALPGPFAIGVWADRGRLSIDVVFPEGMLADEFDEADESVDSELWPPPPAPAAPSRSKVDGAQAEVPQVDGITQLPKSVYKVQPEYPERIRVARLEGGLILEGVVTTRGTVESLEVIYCVGRHPDEPEPRSNLDPNSVFCSALSAAAIEAVSQWRYEPAQKAGTPVASYITVKLDFDLK